MIISYVRGKRRRRYQGVFLCWSATSDHAFVRGHNLKVYRVSGMEVAASHGSAPMWADYACAVR